MEELEFCSLDLAAARMIVDRLMKAGLFKGPHAVSAVQLRDSLRNGSQHLDAARFKMSSRAADGRVSEAGVEP